MATIRIGISGWTYAGWRGVFYPRGLKHSRELEYASRAFPSIEINGSFYSLQRPASYLSWYSATPADFVFAIKAGRFITHMKKLKDVDEAMANFFASGILALREKLGPILWQLPAQFRYDANRMDAFVRSLPRNTWEAAEIASGHAPWMEGRAHTEADRKRPIRHAIEVRHESYRDPRFLRLLSRHGVALVASHSSESWPYFEELTADFVYARLHGQGALYEGSYSDVLDEWEARVRAWARRRYDVYLYFDNDKKVNAPFDAARLRERLGLESAQIAEKRAS